MPRSSATAGPHQEVRFGRSLVRGHSVEFSHETIQISAMIGTVAPSIYVPTAFGSARVMGPLA